MAPYFATPDTVAEILAEPHPKYEERAPDKWNELVKAVYADGAVQLRVLRDKSEATVLKPEQILGDCQLTTKKKGGHIVELEGVLGEKTVQLALCELPNEQWVLAAVI